MKTGDSVVKTVLFYGNFGDGTIISNGQTSKTNNVFKIVSERFDNTIFCKYNTNSFKKNPIWNYFLLKKAISNSFCIIIFPGSLSSLRVFKIAFGKKTAPILYPVVGGWLADKVSGRKPLIKFLKKMYRIYPETQGLKKKLSLFDINNTIVCPTFSLRRSLSFESVIDTYKKNKIHNIFRFVYFGRITESKGIYLAIDSINELNRKMNCNCFLDFYGKLQDKEDLSRFFNNLNENIRYHGVINDEDVTKLCEYDFFLFPTFYDGEGIPACCVESLMFGTPVIASDWKYNKEIIIDGYNGFIFSLEKNDLSDIILKAIHANIPLLKKNSYEDSKRFKVDNAFKPFIDDLEELLYEKV